MKKLILTLLILLSYSFSIAQTLPVNGLVLHYDAQDIDGDGDFTDQPSNGSIISSWTNQSSSANAIASAGNEPTFNANGINVNGAINFDGTNDLFTIANSTDLNTETQTNEISLAIVLETGASVAGEQIIYEQGGGLRGYSFAIQNNHIYAGVWNSSEWDASHQYKSVDLGVVSPNTIYFITIVQNSSSGADATNTLSIYLNGALASSVNHVDPQRAHSGGNGLGRVNNNTVLPADNVVGTTANTDYFQGLIGEFVIWKGALSQTDINDLNTYFIDRWSLQTPPAIDLNGLASNGQNFQTQFSQGSIPVNIANSGAADISDIESTYLSEIEFKINNILDGTDEILTINGVDIVLNTNSVITIPANNGLPILQSTISTGSGVDIGKQILLLKAVDVLNTLIDLSIADGQTILRNITYQNQATPLSTGIRTIEITATDNDNKESAVVTSEIDVIIGAPAVDLNGPSIAGGNYTTNYTNLTIENISDVAATLTALNNLASLELFLAVQDLNLENFNISGTAIDISTNTATLITASTNLNVTVSEVTTGLNAGKQSVLIEPVTALSVNDMQTLLRAITYEHIPGTFSTNDRIIVVVATDINGLSSTQVNTTLDVASPPINNIPGSQSTEANTPLAITNITSSDNDGDLNSVRVVALELGDLDITISGSAVLTGNNVDTLIITGSELDINASLVSLVYTSIITSGSENLEITSTDILGAQDIDEITILISPPPTTGLVLHYDAQDIDGDGDFTDQPIDGAIVSAWVDQSSSTADNASASGGNEPTFNVNGINANGAINFDGSNDLFTIANSTDLNTETQTNEISLAIVLETGASVAGDQIIYEQGGGLRGYSFAIQNNHIYAGIWNNAEWDASHQYKSVDLGVVAPNTVYFITIVQNSSSGVDATNTLSIYLNGTLASSVNHVDPQLAHGGDIGLGRINGGTVLPANNVVGNTGNTNYFQGLIGEFMIWKNALSQTEINDLNTYFINRWSLETPPSIDLNGLASNGQDFDTQFSEGSIPVNIANSGAAIISDIESTNLSNITFKTNNILDGTDEVLNINGGDIILSTNSVVTIPANNGFSILQSTVSAGTGGNTGKQILLLEAVDGSNVVIDLPITDAQTILRSITYENQSTPLTVGIRTIEITATDSESNESAVVNSTINVITGAPIIDLNGPVTISGNYSSNYAHLTTENISDATATITATNNLASLELFLEVQDLNLENFNISGTAIDISTNTATLITASTNLNVTVSEVTTGLNAGKQSVLIEPVTALTVNDMQTILRAITFEHIAGTFSTNDRVIGFIATDINSISSTQVNTTLVAIDGYEWTGTTSTDWNTPSNWNNNITPPSSANIVIPNTTNQPLLDQNRTVKDLTINNSSLDLNTFNLNIEGDLTIITSTISGGESIFTGSIRQNISVTGVLTTENMTINNSNGIELLTGEINLSNTLTLINGDLLTNNGLTLTSNASGTARVATIIGGSIVGNITMQRYINAGSTNWRFLTSPVNGATLAQFNDDFETSGYPGASYPDWPSAANPWPSIYTYDETQSGDLNNGFTAASNASDVMGIGQGYWVWSGDTSTGTLPFTIDLTGLTNTGNLNIPLSFSNGTDAGDGWNMAGNPYPSSIDWDSPNIVKNNINTAIYIWNPDLEQFASYVSGLGTNGGLNNIAAFQGFWVQATSGGASIDFSEAGKTTTDGAFLKQNSILPLRIKAENAYGTDELVINFEANATNQFDANFDAEKVQSTNANLPSISSVFNNLAYSINQMNTQEVDIPISILAGVSGSHILSFENATDFSNASCLILEDLFTGISYDLFSSTSIVVVISDTTQSARFILHIGPSVDILSIDASCFGNNDAQVIYNTNSSNVFDIIWKDSSNSIISSNTNVLISDSIINLTPGNYYIETTDPLCGNLTDTIIIIEPSEITAAFASNTDTVSIALGGNIDFTNQSNNATNYYWDFGDMNNTTVTSPSHQYTQSGTYNVELNAYQNLNCYANKLATIIVIGDIITNLGENIDTDYLKVWTRNNQLIIDGINIDFIEVKNVLGQTLFQTAVNQGSKTIINLNKIKSQILIVTTFVYNLKVSSKINFIKK